MTVQGAYGYMQAERPLSEGAHEVAVDASSRVIVYALTRSAERVDDYVRIALEGLRPHAGRLVVVTTSAVSAQARAQVQSWADDVIEFAGADFTPGMYAAAVRGPVVADDVAELVLTGDSWFGPIGDFASVFNRMADVPGDLWQLVENRHGQPQSFDAQGFPARRFAWTWTVARRSLFTTADWASYWDAPMADHSVADSEREFSDRFEARGFSRAFAFAAVDFPNEHPLLFSPELLLEAGCPIVGRQLFTLYPPFLHQHAVIGRDVLRSIGAHGYPLDPVWENLSRTVAPKALNTIGAMLEILPDRPAREANPSRIAVVMHLTDLRQADDLLGRLAHLPSGYALFVTTSDGTKAETVRRILAERADAGYGRFEVRVTPANRGRDMSDFFVACRDVISSDRFDLIVKVHGRKNRHKTVNLRRYFRRYQWDNLLASRDHVRRLLALFDREPGLGLVFPPMIHIGYSTMGKGWATYRGAAEKLMRELGIRVPVDEVTPLAPYGAMWVARPAALRVLAARHWTYADYNPRRFENLARVQERILVPAAGEAGFHVRTLLTPEHAAISHTAIEFKADQLFSTTSGYPVDQITLIQRAGPAGHGGLVGMSRMYLRLNHPRLARLVLPGMAFAERVYTRAAPAAGALRRLSTRRKR